VFFCGVKQFRYVVGFMFVTWGSSSFAGFLDMPEIEEVPDFEKKTLMLDLDIPSVRERDPDPQGGPRLNVKEFRVQGIVEFPELGITRKALAEKVESLRYKLMSEDLFIEGGYRLDELSEIASLLQTIEEDTEDKPVTGVELQKMVFLLRDQMRKRGVTLGMIEQVSDAISNFYRERGFILAKAFIPEQKVRDGVVTLTLLLGELGEVEAENNSRYSSKTIERAFADQINKPVMTSSIEEGLYLINDLPGIQVQGYFEPGVQVGDTSLHINTVSEEKIAGTVRLDNHGSETTGKYRVYSEVLLFNPFGWSDQLQLAALASFEPDNTVYGKIRYDSYILGPRWRFSTGVSSNDFVSTSILSKTTLEASGKSLVSDVSLGYLFKRSRKRNFSMDLSYTNIQTELTIAGSDRPDTSVDNIRLGVNFDILNERSRALHIGSVGLVSSGSEEEVVGAQSTEINSQSNYYLTADYSILKFMKFPFTDADTRLLIEVGAQYTGESLQSVNQFSMTGPTKVRGFGVNQFFVDSGLRIGSEWMFSAPKFMDVSIFGGSLKDVIQPYVLTDASYGVANSFESDDNSGNLNDPVTGSFVSAGVGLKINIGDNWRGDFSWSKGLMKNISSSEESELESNVYFSLQYGF
jgi:hemolysin activation/secretion protein